MTLVRISIFMALMRDLGHLSMTWFVHQRHELVIQGSSGEAIPTLDPSSITCFLHPLIFFQPYYNDSFSICRSLSHQGSLQGSLLILRIDLSPYQLAR